MSSPKPDGRAACELRFRLGRETVYVRAPVPAGPSRLADVLPALGALTDSVVAEAVRQAERQGRTVSCRKGCGACCRQPVPVAQAEAMALAELVAVLPPARQTAVRERFADGLERLAAAGLLDAVRQLPEKPDDEERRELGLAYFRQGIPCPFLEDEACSIHPQRPLACREYLVTSPPAACSEPDRGGVERLELPGKVSRALYAFGDGSGQGPVRWMPLLLALEWAGAHPDLARRRYSGPELFERFVRHLAGGS